MPKITQFGNASLAQLQNTILCALDQLQTGLSFKFRGGRFTSNVVTLKLECFLPSTDGETVEVNAFKTLCNLHGLATTDLGRKFSVAGHFYILKGMRSCRSKYKFFGDDVVTGKRMVFTRPMLHFIEIAQLPSL
jgi:hypothetical protein